MEELENNGNSVNVPAERPVQYPLVPGEYAFEQQEDMHLRDYLQILLRRRWIIITFFVAVVSTITIGTFMVKPLYKSTVTIKIDRETPNILSFKDIYEVDNGDDNYYQTQYRILKSRNLAMRVIRRMKLDTDPEFAKRNENARITSLIKTGRPPLEQEIDSSLVDKFLSRVEVAPEARSRLVNVSFISSNPSLSEKVANAIGDEFIALNIESKFGTTQEARVWLEKQLDEMKAKVENADEQLNDYARKNGIIFLNGNSKDAKGDNTGIGGNIVTQQLADLSASLSAATSDRIAKEALYNEIRSGDPASSSAVMNNEVIVSLRKDYASVQSEYNQNLKIYKPDYPKMIRLRDMGNQLKKRIDSETKRIVSSIRRDYDAALKRESYVRAAFEKQKSEALDLNNRSFQYETLKREADTDRELYNGLLQRLKETGISANLASSNIQILDRAETPKAPFKPNTRKNIALALAIGLFGGIGLAFFAEYLDNTIKSAEDIEKRVCLPSLGLVPVYNAKEKNMPVESVTHFDGNCPVSEAFSSIRTLLLFSTAGRPPKVMMVTSPRSGEGKTTTLLNTAISLARAGGRVIVVDADMRKPRLHKILSVDNSVGLSSFLSGNAEFGRDLIKKTKIPGLFVLPSGPIPPNASQLLGSSRLRELIDGLYPFFSYILFDTAPMLGLSDAAITSTQTDGVILVVRHGKTPREAAQQAGKILAGLNARVLGVVLNAMSETTLKYNYHYQYYYQPGKNNEKR